MKTLRLLFWPALALVVSWTGIALVQQPYTLRPPAKRIEVLRIRSPGRILYDVRLKPEFTKRRNCFQYARMPDRTRRQRI